MAAMARADVAAARRCPAERAAPHLAARPAQLARARRLAAAIATPPQLIQQPMRPAPQPAQPMARTSAARYRQTAAAARRPVPPPAALRTSTRCSAWVDRVEALARQEFLVRELSRDSTGPAASVANSNIIRWAARMQAAQWAQKAEPEPQAPLVVMPVATPTFQPATPVERKVPAPDTVNTASASAAASGKRA